MKSGFKFWRIMQTKFGKQLIMYIVCYIDEKKVEINLENKNYKLIVKAEREKAKANDELSEFSLHYIIELLY